MLFIRFQDTVGVVQVTVTDKWGMPVFTEWVDTAMQFSLTISLAGLPSGSYVIIFNGNDVQLRGEFEM